MRLAKILRGLVGAVAVAFPILLAASLDSIQAQSVSGSDGGASGVTGRPVTIPLTIRVKGAVPRSELEFKTVDFTVIEDGEPQTPLSIRTMGTNWPINLLVLIQDDVVSSISLEMKSLAEFIRRLPRGSRVSVGYLRTGSLQVRQKFTTDLEKAAKALRSPMALAGTGPYNPYVQVVEGLRRFDSQAAGRRAVLLVSDGLDISRGSDSSAAGQSIDLQRAINEAQRRSTAVYAFFAPTVISSGNNNLISNGQSSLQRLADETGGHAYFQGLGAPTSFDPFIKELQESLDMQIAFTYLSTHPKKGFHRVKIHSSTPGVNLTYPAGYTRN